MPRTLPEAWSFCVISMSRDESGSSICRLVNELGIRDGLQLDPDMTTVSKLRVIGHQQHMLRLGIWSDEQHAQLQAQLEAEVADAQKQAESFGTLLDGHVPGALSMFEDVYKEMPAHLRAQLRQRGFEPLQLLSD